MQISGLQVILILLFMAIHMYDYWNTMVLSYMGTPIVYGFIIGLILGDAATGLKIGATLQLLQLGGTGFGGASAPEYDIGAAVGTLVAVVSGRGMEFGLAIGLPVSVLMIQVDVLTKMIATFFIQRSRTQAGNLNFKAAYGWILGGLIPWTFKALLPILLVLLLGTDRIVTLVDLVPDWIMGSFELAGGLLPAVGIAILLRYMSAKEHLPYLIFGFVLISYLDLPIMAVALIGLGISILLFKQSESASIPEQSIGGGMTDDEL